MDIYTYQDLLSVGDNEQERISFVRQAITKYIASKEYRDAKSADTYKKKRNETIERYQKILYKVTGEAVVDNYSANYKMTSPFYNLFVTQENQYLLGNGVSWQNETTEDQLGTKKKPFDGQLKKAGVLALTMGCSYGFFNLDHLDVFSMLEFLPFVDEEDGSIKAGVRFWRIANNKPLRATLYEIDGYTDYVWVDEVPTIINQKRAYKVKLRSTDVDGTEIYDMENYPSFPIVPLWGNQDHQSELVGLREQIDCYDLIKSGFANTVDEASIVYWTLQNAGGMDDIDLQQFLDKIKKLHAYVGDDAVQIQNHMVEAPYQSRTALLDLLRKDLFTSAMAFDPQNIASGAITATQIKASYELLNAKCDDYEYCVIDFVNTILEIAGIDDKPTFTRSKIVNTTEEIQTLLQASRYLSSDYVTTKILELFGDGDKSEDMIKEMDAESIETYGAGNDEQEEEEI